MRLSLGVSLWLAVFGNLALWRTSYGLAEASGPQGAWFMACSAVMVAALCYLLISIFSYRWLHKPVATALLLGAASGTYFMLTYGVILDTPMMTNVLATDQREALDLLNWRFFAFVMVLGVVPSIWVWRQDTGYRGLIRQSGRNWVSVVLAFALAIGAVLACFQTFSSVHRNHMQVRSLINPLSAIYAMGEIATESLWGRRGPLLTIGEDAVLRSNNPTLNPTLLVLVVGETARAGNFAINGYARDTTPELVKLQKTAHLFSHPEVWSCGTSTEASLPCMFSHLGKSGYESSKVRHESLLDVLQRAGLGVVWVDNQSGCKGLCARVSTVQLDGTGQDVVMLKKLDVHIAKLPKDKRERGVVVVLHQMGSHGPAYYKRSDPARKAFTPECTSHTLSDCKREDVVNAYDNSIRETDYFLGQTVQWLRDHETLGGVSYQRAMLYVSDHGESLGESNLYLHGLPYAIAPDVQKRVPWVTWLSRDFVAARRINSHCLQGLVDKRLSHDHYFHTVLGLTQVSTALYKRELDAYAVCR